MSYNKTPSASRLQAVTIYTKQNLLQLSKAIGYPTNSQLSAIKSGRYAITPSVASRIIDKYPDLSYEWLIDGTGPMVSIRQSSPIHHKIKVIEAKIEKFEKLEGFNTFLEKLK